MTKNWPFPKDYNPTCDERYEHGLEFDLRSYRIIRLLSSHLYKYSDGAVDIGRFGDGDMAQTMAYALDRYFFDMDRDDDVDVREIQLSEEEPPKTGPIEFTTSYGKTVKGYFFSAEDEDSS